jgi:hypothetical protein
MEEQKYDSMHSYPLHYREVSFIFKLVALSPREESPGPAGWAKYRLRLINDIERKNSFPQ